MSDATRDRQLVQLARELERTRARRRKLVKQLQQLDDAIRETRKLLTDLTAPTAADVYTPPATEAAL